MTGWVTHVLGALDHASYDEQSVCSRSTRGAARKIYNQRDVLRFAASACGALDSRRRITWGGVALVSRRRSFEPVRQRGSAVVIC